MNSLSRTPGPGPPRERVPRNKSLATRFTEAEVVRLTQRAALSGHPLAQWMRVQLLAAADRQHDEPIFTELIALCMVINEALLAFTGKFGLTWEYLQGIQERTRRTKRQAARQVLTQYTA